MTLPPLFFFFCFPARFPSTILGIPIQEQKIQEKSLNPDWKLANRKQQCEQKNTLICILYAVLHFAQ